MSKMNKVISYTGENGYRGVMYGKSYMVITNNNGLVMYHTNEREVNNLEELKEFVDGYEEFWKDREV